MSCICPHPSIHPPTRFYPCAGCRSSPETTGNPSSRCHLPSAQPHGPTELGGGLQHHASTPRSRPLVKHSRLCSAPGAVHVSANADAHLHPAIPTWVTIMRSAATISIQLLFPVCHPCPVVRELAPAPCRHVTFSVATPTSPTRRREHGSASSTTTILPISGILQIQPFPSFLPCAQHSPRCPVVFAPSICIANGRPLRDKQMDRIQSPPPMMMSVTCTPRPTSRYIHAPPRRLCMYRGTHACKRATEPTGEPTGEPTRPRRRLWRRTLRLLASLSVFLFPGRQVHTHHMPPSMTACLLACLIGR
ncbi:uncharacterized protein IWZ02DRAFT_194361 [Phyllosticta citriasiana]|uniref:uncharacterized protein n=1 Tax=Phyllosticta citriasiana TaxID=595635 RepID=UPI0030FDBA16